MVIIVLEMEDEEKEGRSKGFGGFVTLNGSAPFLPVSIEPVMPSARSSSSKFDLSLTKELSLWEEKKQLSKK